MGRFDPTGQELSLISRMQLEAAEHYGISTTMEFVDSTSLNNQHDPSYIHSIPESLDIILEERPRERVLRSLGWWSEDEEVLPILAYISKEDAGGENIDIIQGVIVSIGYDINGNTDERLFEVSEVKAVPPGPLFWVCRLTPVRAEFDNEIDQNPEQDTNYTYLEVDEEDDALHNT